MNTQYQSRRSSGRPSKFNSRNSNSRGGSSHGRSSGGRRSSGGGGRNGGGGGRFKGQYIDPKKFVNLTPERKAETEFTPKHTFTEFGLHDRIVENLGKMNITHPTHIQDESIPHVLEGKDVVGLANTGSGKTAAFSLPLIHKLVLLQKAGLKETALILAPTRELAGQIQDEYRRFSQGMNLYSTLCVGGMNIRPQIRELKRGPQVVIGTPGRVKDLIQQKELNLDNTTTFILDEADRMLDMGFLPDIKSIISAIKGKPQTLCFSATITPDISKLLERMLKDPVTISVRTSETGEHIAQDVIEVKDKEAKYETLMDIIQRDGVEKVLIFDEMKFSVGKLAQMLTKDGFPAEAIHGNKSQPQRQRSLKAFKEGKVDILVATDVAARGLDIPNVTHVINFSQPQTYEDYIHRIGRTGRAGKEGQAWTFVIKDAPKPRSHR